MQPKVYVPSATFKKVHASQAFLKFVAGPVGGGKTTGMIMDLHYHDLMMPVCQDDGIRRARTLLVRNTQSMLKTTTIKTFLEWFLEDSPSGKLVKSYPQTYHMRFKDDKGIVCEFEYIFLALDNPKDVRNLLSLEPTRIFFNELREIPWSIFEVALSRPRWPRAERMGLGKKDKKPYGVLADTNKPNERHWINEYFFKNLKKGIEVDGVLIGDIDVFDQPPAFIEVSDGEFVPNPLAENIFNDDFSYYYRQMATMSKESIRVYVCNQFGAVNGGSIIFKGYNSSIHYSKNALLPIPGIELTLGWDFGSTPACVVTQYVKGQLVILREVISAHQINLDDFIRSFVLPILQEDFYKACPVISICDPSGIAGQSYGEVYSIMRLNNFGLNAIPAYSNLIDTRLQTIHTALSSLSEGRPGLILSSKCPFLAEAFASGYRYKQIRHVGSHDPMDSEQPDKNEFSHGMDALQYAAMHHIKPIETNRPRVPQRILAPNGVYIEI